MEFFEVGETLGRRLEARLLPVDGFSKKLLRTDLLGGLGHIRIKGARMGKVNLPGALFLTLGGPRETSITGWLYWKPRVMFECMFRTSL